MNCHCGSEINPKRVALHYKTCLECGAVAAQRETLAKQDRTITMSKSNTVYIGDGEAAKRYAKDIRQMRRGVDD